MIRSILAVCCFLLLGLPAHAAEDLDICVIAYDVARKDMGESGWREYANKAATHYRTTWIDDNPSGNLKRYLDDNLLTRALSVPSGKMKSLKRFMYWLALYRQFREPPPWYMSYLALRYGDTLRSLRADFTWERFAEIVNERKKTIKLEVKKAHKWKDNPTTKVTDCSESNEETGKQKMVAETKPEER